MLGLSNIPLVLRDWVDWDVKVKYVKFDVCSSTPKYEMGSHLYTVFRFLTLFTWRKTMFRFQILLACGIMLVPVAAHAQHFCPDCGRHIAHPISVHSTHSTSTENEVVQAVGEVIEQSVVQPSPVETVSLEQPIVQQPVETVSFEQPVYQQPVTYQQPVSQARVFDNYQAMAQRSASYRASRGIKGHGFTSGQREGVGWSSRSAADAIRNCCYSNSGLPRRVSVVRGRDGWYATTIYLR